MGVNVVQNADGSMDLVGSDNAGLGFINAETEWLAASVDKVFFIAPRHMVVKSITARVETAGTDASAVTAVVKKAASGTAIASGTALHTGSINLKGTAATNQALTLSSTSTDLDIPAGTAIGIDFTGTLTAAAGVVVVSLAAA
jgi:hypothetical protein